MFTIAPLAGLNVLELRSVIQQLALGAVWNCGSTEHVFQVFGQFVDSLFQSG